MARSLTTSQIDRLGDRLRGSAQPSREDLELLQGLRLDYDPPLAKVESLLRDRLGLQPTSRLKTIGTVIDKLKREKTRLSRMQDIAGVRIVREMNKEAQDQLVKSIERLFPGSQVIDRRVRPNQGYRAVHVVPVVDDCPVEIQVRSALQDAWAQIVEKLGDSIGREIRYGELSTIAVSEEGRKWIDTLVEVLMDVSELIAEFEDSGAGPDLGEGRDALRDLLTRMMSLAEEIS